MGEGKTWQIRVMLTVVGKAGGCGQRKVILTVERVKIIVAVMAAIVGGRDMVAEE